MRNGLLFIGEFPPPYGGVTVKDVALCEQIFDGCEVERFNLYLFKQQKSRFFALCLELASAIRRAERIAIGVGSCPRRAALLRIISLLRGRAFLSSVTIFMMGITLPGYLAGHPREIPNFAAVRRIYAEGHSLVRDFEALGVRNASYLPNFRSEEGSREPRPVGDVVRFVFFAKVCREKGADTLLEAVAALNGEGLAPRFCVDVYGHVAPGFEGEFDRLREGLENVRYGGVFDATSEDVYGFLNRYDASSSSSWMEGMSGTNIECKFAGVANIVGDGGLNAESVRDGVDGFVIKAGDVGSLADAMRRVILDHDLLFRMKQSSFASRREFDVAAWRDEVRAVVLGSGGVATAAGGK